VRRNYAVAVRLKTVRGIPKLEFEEQWLDLTADQALMKKEPDAATALERAKDWLAAFLDAGPQSSETVKQTSTGAGISEATLRRAMKEMRIVRTEDARRKWWCSLPRNMRRRADF
jgi:hypothetical protein